MLVLRKLRKPLIHLLLIVGAAVMVYPLVFSLAASLTSQAEYVRSTWFPVPRLYVDNYRRLFQPALLPYVANWVGVTLVRILWYIVWPTAVAVLCGYVFARLRFRGREVAFLVLLGSLLVPGIVFQVPLYVMIARWPLAGGNDILGQGGSGFINQLPSLLLPGIVNAYNIFLVRQTFYSIPTEYEEAARMDGANTPQVLWHVYRPMLGPVIAVLVINTFIGMWNDYVWPSMVVASNRSMWPAALGLQNVMAGTFAISGLEHLVEGGPIEYASIPFRSAAATVATLPPLLCFFFFQRYFVEGLQGFGIKG